MADNTTETDAMLIAGQHAAERLLGSQKLNAGSPYLCGQPPPTPTQVGAVLQALADHGLLMHLATDNTVAAMGEDRAYLGNGWQQATAMGRFFQKMGNWLAYRPAVDTRCEYTDQWTDEVGTIPVCKTHGNNSRHEDATDPHRRCLTVDPCPDAPA